jgi:HEAT repeat protein
MKSVKNSMKRITKAIVLITILITIALPCKGSDKGRVNLLVPPKDRLDRPDLPSWVTPTPAPGFDSAPYDGQIAQQLQLLRSGDPATRVVALENLFLMRAYSVAAKVASLLNAPNPRVRAQAAITLGRIGSHAQLDLLLAAMNDDDWSVRQSAFNTVACLSGQDLPFNATGSKSTRSKQLTAWKAALATLNPDTLAQHLSTAGKNKRSWLERERLAKALWASGNSKSAVPVLVDALKPYHGKHRHTREERLYIQVCIRALGRLGGDVARDTLISLLKSPSWAVYAADALGDIPSKTTALALIKAFPPYAYQLKRALIKPSSGGWKSPEHANGHRWVSKKSPDDFDIGGGGKIWTPRTAYAIMFSLTRMDLSKPDVIRALRGIVPNLLVNMPLDHDGTFVYEVEPWETITAYLTEKAGVRQAVVNAAFNAFGFDRHVPNNLPQRDQIMFVARGLVNNTHGTLTPFASKILLALCRDKNDISYLLKLLDHKHRWVRINAAKTLMTMNAREAVEPIMQRLSKAKDDADYGYMTFDQKWNDRRWLIGYDEYSDPAPRHKEAFLQVLGRLGDSRCVPLLARYLNNGRNAIEIQHAAIHALKHLATPEALAVLKKAEGSHPLHNVRLIAREALVMNRIPPRSPIVKPKTHKLTSGVIPKGRPEAIVFIKGPIKTPNAWFFSSTREAYTQTDEGPVYRVGYNIYKLAPVAPGGTLTKLTNFPEGGKDGYVADIRVSYDGKRIIFCRMKGKKDPWWHIYEMNADGSDMRQITSGNHHDVQPNYLPDGRIVFCSTRLGGRDEYHGYLSTGLTVMNADGSDIHVIGMNCGRDHEPVVNTDGRIVFVRLEAFYSLPKLEFILESCRPDGTGLNVIYGPERRKYWMKNIAPYGSNGPGGGRPGTNGIRHRVVCVSQPQPLDGRRFIINSFRGPMIVGPERNQERIIRTDTTMAVTTPYPVDENTLLCAAGKRLGRRPTNYAPVDHGLYWMNMKDGELELIYNDPKTAEFEARPLRPRPLPRIAVTSPEVRQGRYTGKLYCASIYNTQQKDVIDRGKYVRIIEGQPEVQRHSTHTSGGKAWMNHGGLIARVLGTVPVDEQGAFAVQLPADRLFHIQVIDTDGYVVGNELNWQYVRPAETKGCVGCHEKPNSAPMGGGRFSQAFSRCLPQPGQMQYRAKNWIKRIHDEDEERKRTINSINVMGRL